MRDRIKNAYYHWKYLGFSSEILVQYEERIAEENLRLLKNVLWATMLIVALAIGLLIYALKVSSDTEDAIYHSFMVLGIALTALIFQIVQNNWMLKSQKYFRKSQIARWTTTIYLIVAGLTAIIIETIFYPNAYSTLVCGMLLISQIMFISYPMDNLLFMICFSSLFVVLDVIFKKPEIYVYDLIDSLPFVLLGGLLSWERSHARWEIMIHTEHEKQLERERMEDKMRENRIDVMLTQIQPHFIYNTLEGIGELCHSNPAYAEKAVTEFSCFLRGNLSVLNDQKIIPFEQELAHIKHYLFCEKMRFEERLRVEYNIQAMDFSVPTLSLQPIVENAVRYGISKKEEGGTIMIGSKEQEEEWVITVIDDGEGFSDSYLQDGKRKHIGIENVRTRLKEQCGGRLEINSEKGKGTIVKIYLPKNLEDK